MSALDDYLGQFTNWSDFPFFVVYKADGGATGRVGFANCANAETWIKKSCPSSDLGTVYTKDGKKVFSVRGELD